MTVGITPFVIQIRVAQAVVHNLSMTMMLGMTHLRLLPEAQVRLHHVVRAVHLPADLAEVPGAHQEVHRGVQAVRLEGHLVPPVVPLPVEAQAVAHLVAVQAAALPVGAQAAAHPVAVQAVVLPVEVQAAVHLVAVQVAAHRRRDAALQADYNTIQTPSPASKIPIASSTLRAFSSMVTINGVPEMISATKTYQPPSIHIAIHATNALSPHVKSG